MAAEVGAFSAIVPPDAQTLAFLVSERGLDLATAGALIAGLASDPDADFETTIEIDGAEIRPLVALPGDPGNGIAVADLGALIKIDIAYAGSCTAGKKSDLDMYAAVFAEAAARGDRIAPHVRCYIQVGSQDVRRHAEQRGYLEIFERVGAILLEPGCGACINAGPGVSFDRETVTVSAINRNFPGRSGPGKVYLASPYTVAASALAGWITVWDPYPAGTDAA
jgi:3-isopropylmalate/(R)-2-methylmalate dehydratase large subunit